MYRDIPEIKDRYCFSVFRRIKIMARDTEYELDINPTGIKRTYEYSGREGKTIIYREI